MSIAYLMLGSNLGDKKANLILAREELLKATGELLAISKVYESEPWGFSHSENFLNQLLVIRTKLVVTDLLAIILSIEEKLGRKRTKGEYEARTIDIDILFYDRLILKSDLLEIPHPRIAQRRFVLVPLLEICPTLVHPVNGKTIWQMNRECGDKLGVKGVD